MKAFYVCSLAALAITANGFAADTTSKYQDAFADFTNRGADVKNAQSCADKAGAAAAEATTDLEKYNALVLQSRCTYYVGMQAKKSDDKIRIFGAAKNLADKAKPLQKDRAEAYFYYGISLGRWAEANGIMKSLGERFNLRRTMDTVLTKTAFDDDGKQIAGKEYDSYGANRTIGRLLFKLPGLFGGDNRKAEEFLRVGTAESEKMGVRNSLNILYLAEVLVANNKKPEARLLLDGALKFESDPTGYNPKRVPETIDEMKDIRALRNELGN
ncbi:MAG: hypothetical protein HY074_15830 [Deltaproteobacteria bacterium]|nr:hypothetical protein [Deltaproteobacteria bacterium]